MKTRYIITFAFGALIAFACNKVEIENVDVITNSNEDTFYEIKDAGHGFNGEKFDEALGYIIGYLKNIKVINE